LIALVNLGTYQHDLENDDLITDHRSATGYLSAIGYRLSVVDR
jgi:hypothetical protein